MLCVSVCIDFLMYLPIGTAEWPSWYEQYVASGFDHWWSVSWNVSPWIGWIQLCSASFPLCWVNIWLWINWCPWVCRSSLGAWLHLTHWLYRSNGAICMSQALCCSCKAKRRTWGTLWKIWTDSQRISDCHGVIHSMQACTQPLWHFQETNVYI